MKSDYFEGLIVAMVMTATFLVTTIIAIGQRDEWQSRVVNLKQQAIELGYAHYNGTNGLWEWKR